MHTIEQILAMDRHELRQVKEVQTAPNDIREKVIDGRETIVERSQEIQATLDAELKAIGKEIEVQKGRLNDLLSKNQHLVSEITAEKSAHDKILYVIDESLKKQHPKNIKAQARA